MAFIYAPVSLRKEGRRDGTTTTTTTTAPKLSTTRSRMIAAPPKTEKVVTVEPKTERKTKKPKMYRLCILNDPFNTKSRVIQVLLKVVQGLTFSRASMAMEEAHNQGKGVVAVFHQELAEHYCSTINSSGIFSIVEPED